MPLAKQWGQVNRNPFWISRWENQYYFINMITTFYYARHYVKTIYIQYIFQSSQQYYEAGIAIILILMTRKLNTLGSSEIFRVNWTLAPQHGMLVSATLVQDYSLRLCIYPFSLSQLVPHTILLSGRFCSYFFLSNWHYFVCVCVWSCSVMSDSLWSCGL